MRVRRGLSCIVAQAKGAYVLTRMSYLGQATLAGTIIGGIFLQRKLTATGHSDNTMGSQYEYAVGPGSGRVVFGDVPSTNNYYHIPASNSDGLLREVSQRQEDVHRLATRLSEDVQMLLEQRQSLERMGEST